MSRFLLSCAALAALLPTAANATEVFGGIYKHDVDTPLTKSGIEHGLDFQIGVRGGKLGGTPLQPYAFGALNSAGDTSYAAVGISARFGDRFFVRPGVGLAIHNGSSKKYQDLTNDKIDFGSRILFEPELGVGFRANDRVSVEASWVHMSHAQLFSRQNPGIDNIGVRLTLGL